MTTNTHNGRWSHRLGRGAGRAWRGYLRREQRVAGWLVTRGVGFVESFDVGVLRGLAWLDVMEGDTLGLCPFGQCVGNELGAIVQTYR